MEAHKLEQDSNSEHMDYHMLSAGHGGGHPPHHEEGEGPWLMSFADMVTLLMCFFILFFSMNKDNIEVDDPEKLKELIERLTEIVNTEDKKTIGEGRPSVRTPISTNTNPEVLKQALEQLSQALDIVFTMAQPEPGRLEITFLNSNFFYPGRAEPTVGGVRMVQMAANQLKNLSDDVQIEVHGHTDSDPVRSTQFPSNWELSSARSSTVLKILAESGLAPERMRAVGFAHFQPIAPEKTKDGYNNIANKALNRRVVIVAHFAIPAKDAKTKK